MFVGLVKRCAAALAIVAVAATACSGSVYALSDSSVSSLSQLDCTCHGYGQGREVDENNRPTGAMQFNDEYNCYNSYAIFDGKGICLTFDQGYENGYTAKILDTLKEKNVKAVFFLTGDYAKKEKALVRRMIDEGHIIGNHGMKHKSLPKLDTEAAEEIMSLHKYVLDEYNYNMVYFRPPCGEYSEKALAECNCLGYKTMFWSFAYCDWDVNNQPDCIEANKRVTGAAHDGAIYLLHSVSATNAEILPRIIDEIRAQGYEFTLPSV